MYLVYIYNGLIFNLFLTFLLCFYLLRFKVVLGHLCERIKNAKYGETVRIIFTLAGLVHNVFTYAVFSDLI